MKYRTGIIGSFGFGCELRDGQTVKTQQLAETLAEKEGAENILCIDTHGWKHAPWRLFFNVIRCARNCDRVIMLPAHGALKVIPRLALAARKRYIPLFYDVIGGWLPEFLDDKPDLKKALMRLDGIWVETKGMKEKLLKRGFKNVEVVPNFKNIIVISENDLHENIIRNRNSRNLTFVTFSRVMKEKGIEEAIDAVISYNAKRTANQPEACLKIYGQIAPDYRKRFDEKMTSASNAVEYCGVIPPGESRKAMQEAFMLLFPTFYPGEGFPGTIIDAFSAGVPVIASDWRYNPEIVKEGVTGYLYPTHRNDALNALLQEAVENREKVDEMRINCTREAAKYDAAAVSAKIEKLLDGATLTRNPQKKKI